MARTRNKATLATALRNRTSAPAAPPAAPASAPPTPTAAAPAPAPKRGGPGDPAFSRGPSRNGRRALTIYLEPHVHKQMRSLGVETDRTLQEMGVDAVNEFFVRNGLPGIAD